MLTGALRGICSTVTAWWTRRPWCSRRRRTRASASCCGEPKVGTISACVSHHHPIISCGFSCVHCVLCSHVSPRAVCVRVCACVRVWNLQISCVLGMSAWLRPPAEMLMRLGAAVRDAADATQPDLLSGSNTWIMTSLPPPIRRCCDGGSGRRGVPPGRHITSKNSRWELLRCDCSVIIHAAFQDCRIGPRHGYRGDGKFVF